MRITRRELRRLIEATIQFSDEEKEEIKKAKTTAIKNVADGIGRDSGISTDAVVDAAEKVDDEEEVNETLRELIGNDKKTYEWSASEQEVPDLDEKKKRKKKRKKRKNKYKIYPYVFGFGHHLSADDSEGGFEGGDFGSGE